MSETKDNILSLIESRLDNMIHAPQMWGGPEAVEMQILTALEIRTMCISPNLITEKPRVVIDAYVDFLMKKFPTYGRLPLHQIVEDPHGDGAGEFRNTILEFQKAINFLSDSSAQPYTWPLGVSKPTRPIPSDALFGARRKFDIHTGIDLYAPIGDNVLAMESGEVVNIIDFTGPAAGCGWWLPTKAVMVEGNSGVILYGEMSPGPYTRVGRLVSAGEYLGRVERVLKNDKGRPTSMLHVEYYEKGTKECTHPWKLNCERPPHLMNPWPLLASHLAHP